MHKTSVPTNDTLWVADALPHQQPEIKKVNKHDFASRHGFTWTEDFQFPAEFSQAQQVEFKQKLETHLQQNFKRTLAEVEDQIMLCPMGKAGFGAFARKDITHGVVAVYVGRYVTPGAPVALEPGYKNYSLNTANPTVWVDSFKHRNIASYFQHLFQPESHDVMFHREPSEHIAVANLTFMPIEIMGWPVIIITTTQAKIPKHTLLGYDYNLGFFDAVQVEPLAFKANGEVYQGPKLYTRCAGKLLDIRRLAYKLYLVCETYKEVYQHQARAKQYSQSQFISELKQRDYDVLRAVAINWPRFSYEFRAKGLPAVWKNSDQIIALVAKNIDLQHCFLLEVERCELMYQISELLAGCKPDMISKLNNPYPAKFNYWQLISDGYQQELVVGALVQSIILKNTGVGRVAKEGWAQFFDTSKAFFNYVDRSCPRLRQHLLGEKSKYKAANVTVAATKKPRLQVPLKQTTIQSSTADYKQMKQHLVQTLGGDWSANYANKKIWPIGNEAQIKKLHAHLTGSDLKLGPVKPWQGMAGVFYFMISEPQLDYILNIKGSVSTISL